MDEGFILLPVHNLHGLQFNGCTVQFGIDHAPWRVHTMDISNTLPLLVILFDCLDIGWIVWLSLIKMHSVLYFYTNFDVL